MYKKDSEDKTLHMPSTILIARMYKLTIRAYIKCQDDHTVNNALTTLPCDDDKNCSKWFLVPHLVLSTLSPYQFSGLLVSEPVIGYLGSCCRATPNLSNASAWVLRHEHHLLYLLVRLAHRVVSTTHTTSPYHYYYHTTTNYYYYHYYTIIITTTTAILLLSLLLLYYYYYFTITILLLLLVPYYYYYYNYYYYQYRYYCYDYFY